MYDINEENLRYAYWKLKRFVYYYTSSNYLKDKIIKFERTLKENNEIFKTYADNLIALRDKNIDSKVGYCIYPKKDSFFSVNDSIKVNSVNTFIDIDIMLLLNDILFCLELYKPYKRIQKRLFYGNLFDSHLNKEQDIISNNMLFDRYWPNYIKWKEDVTKDLDKTVIRNSTLIKLDFKRCFYNTKFNIHEFLKYKCGIELNSPVVDIAIKVYQAYSRKIDRLTGDITRFEYTQLPIGLPSASILQNLLFSQFDQTVASSEHVKGYSRYVDDVLVLMDINVSNTIDLCKYIEAFTVNNTNKNIIDVRVSNYVASRLQLNTAKIEIKKGTSIQSITKKIEQIVLPSFVEIEGSSPIPKDGDNEEDMIDNSLSQKYLKSRINYMYEQETDPKEFYKFISSIKPIDLLNVYSSWNKILYILKKDRELYLDVTKQISDSIDKLIYDNQEKYINLPDAHLIKKTLKEDLRVAKLLNARSDNRLFRITQKDIFDYINLAEHEKARNIYFPEYIPIEYIQLYLCLNNKFNKDIFSNSKKMYSFVNKIKIDNNHPINNTTFSNVVNCDIRREKGETIYGNIYSRIDTISLDSRATNKDKIKIAVMSVKMPFCELEKTECHSKYPTTYSLKTLKNNIKTAKDYGAEYIVMPEFCIPNTDMIKVVKYCKDIGISLVAGLTHYIDARGAATNYIIIYDNIMNLALLKPKNYYPYFEKLQLAKNGYTIKMNYPYYIVVDNGELHYSTMTCFEATNIRDRAFLNDIIDALFVPVYNQDTKYFSDIVGSMTRDLSSFIIQANNSEYGDSRITGPMQSYEKDIIKIKGGDNCYVVVGTIDLKSMRDKHTFMAGIDKDISGLLKMHKDSDRRKEAKKIKERIDDDKENNVFKPLSAGSRLKRRQYNNIE